MGELLKDIETIALAIVGLAVLAVLVSKQANTSGVINSSSSAFNTGIATAEGPVTGYSPGPPIYANSNAAGFLSLPNIGEVGAGFNTAGAYGT